MVDDGSRSCRLRDRSYRKKRAVAGRDVVTRCRRGQTVRKRNVPLPKRSSGRTADLLYGGLLLAKGPAPLKGQPTWGRKQMGFGPVGVRSWLPAWQGGT